MNSLIKLHSNEMTVSALSLFKGELGTTTAIRLAQSGILKEHITKIPALLLCISGTVAYNDENGQEYILKSGDYVLIVPHVKHWLTASEISQLVLLK